MQISTTLKLIDFSLPAHQGRGTTLRVFRGAAKISPYIGIARENNLIALGFVGPESSADHVREDLCNRPAWRQAIFEEAQINTENIEALELWGTPFQIKVWQALYSLPRHQTTTYKEIAHQAGYSGAFQAVGQAISRNPISLLIPCHLVIKSSGEIGEYYWGRSLKKKLLHSFPPNPL